MRNIFLYFILLLMCGLAASADNNKSYELPEVTVKTRKKEVLHLLGYMREYSTLTTYSDTIFLFREKTVDFMVPAPKIKNFKGWLTPRIIASKSYYHFTSADGTDSVSDTFRQHFSWSDWVGLNDNILIPEPLRDEVTATFSRQGKYTPSVIWERNDADMRLKINMLADSDNASWVPELASYIYGHHGNVEFTSFKLDLNYKGIDNTILTVDNLTDMSFDIETTGRARKMFRVFSSDCTYFVNTHAELYIIDREYIPASIARKWQRSTSSDQSVGIYRPQEAGGPSPDIENLIARVNKINHTQRHLDTSIDYKVAGMKFTEQRYSSGILGFLYNNFGFRF